MRYAEAMVDMETERNRTMNEFKEGQYIICHNESAGYYELGCIKSLTKDGAFVVYHSGEAGVKTPYELMHPLVNEFEIQKTLEKRKTGEEHKTGRCEFCRNHERGDTLYEPSHWDGGLGFDYIRDIQFCPKCGRELQDG